ncbi:MAG: hypothetical protein A2Y62_06060 [Candidatus Fischerbacteria bacterium RBG_13_37_8]|uniref:Protein TolR n=1 Tax=Candidatus Fischerbacteria bacterium RBG_13_37_8 TaxID=1817863 RepID=A0A1F5VRP5_9BACT|nr:MAG: hypothetical protein A2Y62_06060 [Candidatus Fischerbacteria bacterium RBG_13_37_8]
MKVSESNDNRTRITTTLAEINVTPLVDVVLVLLIIFMVTAPLLQKGIDVKLPQSQVRDSKPEDRVVVTIAKDNKIFINANEVSMTEFEEEIQRQMMMSASPAVYIKADQDVTYGMVIKVMDRLKKAGIDTIGMVTEPYGMK